MPGQLLLTGASGFLGWNIIQLAQPAWQVTGMVNRHTADLPAEEIISVDISDTEALQEALKGLKPDAIIHTAAISDANYCQQHPEESYRINVEASVVLAKWAASLQIPFVFTSTDLVFDGKKGHYTEDDKTHPLNAYGRQKEEAEQRILEVYPQACVCRMPLMFGHPGPHAQSFIQPFLRNLRSGQAINLFIDEYRTAVDGGSAAKGLLLAVEKGWTGIWHLGGPDRLSRYEFGVMLAETMGVTNPNINPIRQQDLQMAAPRPADVSLNSTKAFQAGYAPLANQEALQQFKGII